MRYDHVNGLSNVIESENGRKITFNYPCPNDPYPCSPYTITLKRGTYYLEVYGAQGSNVSGTSHFATGGRGGYSSGVYKVEDIEQNIYLYVGATAEPIANPNKDVFNGGSRGIYIVDGPGGGATDFRTIKESLYSRIIVAGGGGGGFSNEDLHANGGSGGGYQGYAGESSKGFPQIPCVGSQYDCIEGFKNSEIYYPGSFGKGGGPYCGGGGGGYFGGGSTSCSGGGGGSGYVGGVLDHPIYKKQTINDINWGFGWAQLTIISITNTCSKDLFKGYCMIYIVLLM